MQGYGGGEGNSEYDEEYSHIEDFTERTWKEFMASRENNTDNEIRIPKTNLSVSRGSIPVFGGLVLSEFMLGMVGGGTVGTVAIALSTIGGILLGETAEKQME